MATLKEEEFDSRIDGIVTLVGEGTKFVVLTVDQEGENQLFSNIEQGKLIAQLHLLIAVLESQYLEGMDLNG